MMNTTRVLLVDADENFRQTQATTLRANGFEVTTAANVQEAQHQIAQQPFDVVVCDPQLPGPTDGLQIFAAAKSRNPATLNLIQADPQNPLSKTDQIMIKPTNPEWLVETIRTKLAFGPVRVQEIESLASILERSTPIVTDYWYQYLSKSEGVMNVKMTKEVRTAHIPQILTDLARRLRSREEVGTNELVSEAAIEHGANRFRQGYAGAMLVEEARALQVSIFRTLQNNLSNIDLTIVLQGVMIIADEVDSQLSQSMSSFDKARAHQQEPMPA